MTVFGVTIVRLSPVSEQKSHVLRSSPGEIKRREVSSTLTRKLAQKRSRAGRWCWARERVGLLFLEFFPNGGATDIVFVTLFCIAVGTAIA